MCFLPKKVRAEVVAIRMLQAFSQGQNPFDEIPDFGWILALDYLVFLFVPIFELDFLTRGDVMGQLLYRVGLAAIFAGNFPPGRGLFLPVDQVALEAVALFGQIFRRHGVGRIGCRHQGKHQQEHQAM
jgi:hypothetical protein